MVGIITDGKDMWRHFNSPLSPVGKYNFLCIDWNSSVGIHSDTEQTRVRLEIEKKTRVLRSKPYTGSHEI